MYLQFKDYFKIIPIMLFSLTCILDRNEWSCSYPARNVYNLLPHICHTCHHHASFFFWLHPTACRILVSQPGMEPSALAVRMPSPNHRNIREYTPCVFRRNYLDVGGNAKDKPLRKIPLIWQHKKILFYPWKYVYTWMDGWDYGGRRKGMEAKEK